MGDVYLALGSRSVNRQGSALDEFSEEEEKKKEKSATSLL